MSILKNIIRSVFILTLLSYFFNSIHADDEEFETITIELLQVVEKIASRYKKPILPNDGILAALRSRKATLVLPKGFEANHGSDEVWNGIYDQILGMYGYTLIESESSYRLVTIKDAIGFPTPLRIVENKESVGDRIITQVVVLKHVVSDIVRPLLRYVSQTSAPIALPDKKTLVITAHASDIIYFLKLVDVVDVAPEEIYSKSYILKHINPHGLMKNIQNHINVNKARAKGAVSPETQPIFLADSRTAKLIVNAEKEVHDLVEYYISELDLPEHESFSKLSAEEKSKIMTR